MNDTNIYPNLKQNGKIFPSWIMYKFNKYLFKPSSIDEDVCNPKTSKRELRPYQEFISKYLDYMSPYNSILLYHGVGSGKTATAIEVYNNLYKYTEKWNVIILIKSALKSDWERELNTWLTMDTKDRQLANIQFISYNSSVAWQHFQELQKKLDVSRKNLYIIDECHNFIRTVYNSVVNNKSGQSQQIYNYLVNEKRDSPATRIIAISATPGINHIFEFALLFNLLRPDIFPAREEEFNHTFLTIDNSKGFDDYDAKISISPDKINLFQRRILGLVSYFDSSDPKAFAKKNIHYINIEMGHYQKSIYDIFAEREAQAEQKHKFKNRNNGTSSKLYKVYTRSACNFVFPTVNGIDGILRPRPHDFNISEEDADALMHAKEDKNLTEKYIANLNKDKYLLAIDKYINTFKEYIAEIHSEDIKNKHTIIDDLENIKKILNLNQKQSGGKKVKGGLENKTEENDKNIENNQVKEIDNETDNKTNSNQINNIIETYIKDKKSSKLLKELYRYSPKYTCMVCLVYNSPGPTILYTAYVRMEGTEILKIYLSCAGFVEYNLKNNDSRTDYKRFVEYNGLIDQKIRKEYQSVYNDEDNVHGKNIKCILLSQAGSEGINLYNVRQIHIAEPHWNEALMEQVIGRGVRRCSHQRLPPEERIVDVYRYKMTFSNKDNKGKPTTDEHIEKVALDKTSIINKFLKAIKEVAVDCELNKENNIINNKDLTCFKFDEQALLTDKILPAYQEVLEDDFTENTGLNATNNELIKDKVYRIKAVILEDIETNKYSKQDDYWLNKNTGSVYNYKYKYLVGRVKFYIENNEMIFDQDDDGNFIIDFLTPYPGINPEKKKE